MRENFGVSLPPFKGVNKILLITLIALFLVESIASKALGFSLIPYLSLSHLSFSGPLLYTPLTYPLISNSLFDTLFNGLIFWMIGVPLESLWGKRVYLIFLFLMALAGAIGFTLAFLFLPTAMVFGPSAMAAAMLVSYGILNPNQSFLFMFIFPIKALYFCLILAGMEIYIAIFSQGGLASAVTTLFSMGAAFLFVRYFTSSKAANILNFNTRSTKKAGKGRLKLVSDDDEKPPKYWQ